MSVYLESQTQLLLVSWNVLTKFNTCKCTDKQEFTTNDYYIFRARISYVFNHAR